MPFDRSKTPTCGVLYREALEHYIAMDPERVRMFTAGFCTGQAEKVHLGACKAAMFRPSAENREMLLEVLIDIAERYVLCIVTTKDEIWIARRENAELVRKMKAIQENSPEWHEFRGMLCGVPAEEIDRQFHHRHGYGERAD